MKITDAEVRQIVDAVADDDSVAWDRLVAIAEEHPELVAPHLLRLIEMKIWLPAHVFRAMTEDTAGDLVRRIDDGTLPPGLVYRLAAGRTRTAADAFARWTATPPAWLATLPEDLAAVGHVGGWELDPAGHRRDLISRTATALVPAAEPGSSVSGGALDTTCGWCGLPMWRLLEASLPSLVPGRFLVATCVRCGCYADLFTADGRFLPENGEPGFICDDEDGWELPEERLLTLGEARPDPWATGAGQGWSTLGGLPKWEQDPAYPVCPRCSRTMLYVGQITGKDREGSWGQGCHYLFHDPNCGLSAAVYQQT
ncbi:MAG: hypothetical protein ABW022_14185 [Actinoplanes sp.]